VLYIYTQFVLRIGSLAQRCCLRFIGGNFIVYPYLIVQFIEFQILLNKVVCAQCMDIIESTNLLCLVY